MCVAMGGTVDLALRQAEPVARQRHRPDLPCHCSRRIAGNCPARRRLARTLAGSDGPADTSATPGVQLPDAVRHVAHHRRPRRSTGPPRKHLVTYHGVLAPASGLRSKVELRQAAHWQSVEAGVAAGCRHRAAGAGVSASAGATPRPSPQSPAAKCRRRIAACSYQAGAGHRRLRKGMLPTRATLRRGPTRAHGRQTALAS